MPISKDSLNTTPPSAAPIARAPQPLIREGAYVMSFKGSKEVREPAYGEQGKEDPKMVDRIVFIFQLLLPQADEALSKLEALEEGPAKVTARAAYEKKFVEKGHGRFFYLTVNKPSFVGLPKGEGRVSSLYSKVLIGMLNDGSPLTKQHLDNLVPLLNGLEGLDDEGQPIEGFVEPQFYGMIVKTTPQKADQKPKNRLDKISSRVPEEDVIPPYQRLSRFVDPREADDDPTIVCAVTGEQIHGYEPSVGPNAGVWQDNRKVAASSVERYGMVLSPSEIRKVKDRKAAQEAAEENGTVNYPF